MLSENEFSVCFSQNSLLSKVLRVLICNIFQLFSIRFFLIVSHILVSIVTFTNFLNYFCMLVS